jgi:hypothetical protein
VQVSQQQAHAAGIVAGAAAMAGDASPVELANGLDDDDELEVGSRAAHSCTSRHFQLQLIVVCLLIDT